MPKNRSLFVTQKKPWLARLVGWLFSGLFTLLLILGTFVYVTLRLSYPQYDGEVASNVSDKVSISRDQLGVPYISANSRSDLAFALGWTHAQERFFQMDLQRRQAAGELSEIFGKTTLTFDKANRRHRFRARAKAILSNLPHAERELLNRYSEGVNAGLNSLREKPFEYWLLNNEPMLWLAEDSILTVYSMYLALQPSSIEREKVLQKGYSNLPKELYQFLVPNGSELDAPIDFSNIELPQIPNSIPDSVKLISSTLSYQDDFASGSNNFAIGAKKSASNQAMIAGDMHLGLSVPTIWFKASMEYVEKGQNIKLVGVTLPGTPFLIAGTNHQIAWAFTNSYGDYFDSIPIELIKNDPDSYLYQGQPKRFETFQEIIKVKGEPPITFPIKESIYGPVEMVEDNVAWSYLWVAHDLFSINLNLQRLEQAQSVYDAISIAKTTSMPAQNFVAVDTSGNIGWTIIGPLPKRRELNATDNPLTTIEFINGKIQWLSAEKYPELINPPNHTLWTANNRIVGHDALNKIGNGGYILGIRSRQIRDRLLTKNKVDEMDLLKIQLDTHSPLHLRWKEQLIALLREEQLVGQPLRREFRDLVANWDGEANINEVGFTLIKTYRQQVYKKLLEPWKKQFDPKATHSFSFYSKHYEYPLWQLVTQQPESFLPKGYTNYSDLLLKAVDTAIKKLTADGTLLAAQSWGNHNQLNIQHPISRAVPILGVLLDRPTEPMPGSIYTPRVQGRSFGASQRMVIAPGMIEKSIYHMPGGQSGHPLSPYYSAGFNAWVTGEPLPLISENKIHHFQIKPLK